MPLPILTVPDFPFVPLMAGVPALVRAPIDINAPALLSAALAGAPPSALLTSMLNGAVPSMLNGYLTTPIAQLSAILSPAPATSDSASQSGTVGPQWGIFDNGGNQVVTPDSVVSFEWSGAYRILDYPIQAGNFESYNKVQQPFETRVVMRKGGTVSDRQSFIDALETVRASLCLYSVATPEKSYDNANITDVTYSRRSDAGATVIEATITLKQVNVTASSSFSNVQQPTAKDATNGGTVDAATPTPTQSASVDSQAGSWFVGP